MRRRDFLRKTSIATSLASIPAVTLASAAHIKRESAEKLKNASDATRDVFEQRMTAVERRVDKLGKSQKKTMRLLVVLTGVSVGLDLSLLV